MAASESEGGVAGKKREEKTAAAAMLPRPRRPRTHNDRGLTRPWSFVARNLLKKERKPKGGMGGRHAATTQGF